MLPLKYSLSSTARFPNRRPSSPPATSSSSAPARDESRLTRPQLRLGPEPPVAAVDPQAMSCRSIEPGRFGSGSSARPGCWPAAGGGLSEEVDDGGEVSSTGSSTGRLRLVRAETGLSCRATSRAAEPRRW
uniref:Uncharacterized protein n=1 Tax=Arundo donax TaxID=35708 RepID=A0A0A9HX64_ARUDO